MENNNNEEYEDIFDMSERLMKEKKERIQTLKKQIKIQCTDGNWNYSPYMHGMANGLICALATLEGKEPEYLAVPAIWLCDVP
jgi:hypothetical protein